VSLPSLIVRLDPVTGTHLATTFAASATLAVNAPVATRELSPRLPVEAGPPIIEVS
jgi:hypothetical protein